MELLRFFTAGNVDDGKSTLIGRLLFDSDSISTDIIETLTRQSKTTAADTPIDLALLTDGLRAEREQGITIDVAYKYFTTAKRKFIIADTPGHAEYTRNMFTGASTADLAIILVDARNGITEQTRRHSIIASILRIPEVIICVNKMDLVGYDEAVFNQIHSDYSLFARQIGLSSFQFIPVSALEGVNVVNKSDRMPWYSGPALLDLLETIEIDTTTELPARFQVQLVIRPQTTEWHDYRGYAGTLLSGSFSKGERVHVYPTDRASRIVRIEKHQQEVETAHANEPVVLHLEDDLDISRGSSLCATKHLPDFDTLFEATICWMDNKAFQPGQKFLLQHNSFRTKAMIKSLDGKVNIQSGKVELHEGGLELNEFGQVWIKTAEPVAHDSFSINKRTGAFILINEHTNNTVAAGVIH